MSEQQKTTQPEGKAEALSFALDWWGDLARKMVQEQQRAKEAVKCLNA